MQRHKAQRPIPWTSVLRLSSLRSVPKICRSTTRRSPAVCPADTSVDREKQRRRVLDDLGFAPGVGSNMARWTTSKASPVRDARLT
jgi:hypothetical protein